MSERKTAKGLAAEKDAEKDAEILEQCRLNAMGAEREDRLRAQVAERDRRITELEAENFRLAAGQCPDGLGDEGGTPRCCAEVRIRELEAALAAQGEPAGFAVRLPSGRVHRLCTKRERAQTYCDEWSMRYPKPPHAVVAPLYWGPSPAEQERARIVRRLREMADYECGCAEDRRLTRENADQIESEGTSLYEADPRPAAGQTEVLMDVRVKP